MPSLRPHYCSSLLFISMCILCVSVCDCRHVCLLSLSVCVVLFHPNERVPVHFFVHVYVCVLGSTRWLLRASLSLWECGQGLAKLSVMSVEFSVDGKASAVSPTEPNSDWCMFVLDVSARRLMLNRPQTQANTVQRGTGGRTCGMLGNEIRWDQGLDHGNLSRFMDVKSNVKSLRSLFHFLYPTWFFKHYFNVIFCLVQSQRRAERASDLNLGGQSWKQQNTFNVI